MRNASQILEMIAALSSTYRATKDRAAAASIRDQIVALEAELEAIYAARFSL